MGASFVWLLAASAADRQWAYELAGLHEAAE
jgi:hypothetical protein